MRARVKDGMKEEFIRVQRERARPELNPGFVSAEVAWEDSDPNRLVLVIHFKDRESYMANASRPDTEAEYERMVQYLEAPPEWIDVHFAEVMSAQPVSAT